MSIKILGIHDGHNASAALLANGKVEFAIQEERLSRRKNQGGVPVMAIQEILDRTGYLMSDIDYFALNGKYMIYYDSYKEAVLGMYSKSFSNTGIISQKVRHSIKKIPQIHNIYEREHQKRRLQKLKQLGCDPAKVISVDHHTAHAAAAYYGYRTDKEMLILTCDARGDNLCGSVNIGSDGQLTRIAEIHEDNSIGRIYSLVTYIMGMVPLEHEYKIMGLAPYAQGNEEHVGRICDKFLRLFEIDPKEPLTWKRSQGIPSIFTATDLIANIVRHERFDWIAAGLQRFIEVFLCDWVTNCITQTGIRSVAVSGGVFMNVKLNKRILELAEVEELFVFPSCGDETNAIGSAFWIHANQSTSAYQEIDKVQGLYWGGDFSNEQIESAIEEFNFSGKIGWDYQHQIEKKAAELIASGEVVARATERMEFGARALGNRSILADPRKPETIRIINDMIKKRDFWMPFAPSVLDYRAEDYYIKPKSISAPYMILAFDTKPDKLDSLFAATHPYDNTTRPHEVYEDWNEHYYKLFTHYEALTGEGILLNTSFNLHGFPIVYSPQDSLEVFDQSGLKYLALGNFLIVKG